jgi:hypothetical protein
MTIRWWKGQGSAVPDRGGAAVGLVPGVVHLAPAGGLGAAAGPLAVPVPQQHGVADPGRDRLGDAGISASRGLVNQRNQESRNTSRRVIDGQRHAAMKGRNHGGKNRPYGWRKDHIHPFLRSRRRVPQLLFRPLLESGIITFSPVFSFFPRFAVVASPPLGRCRSAGTGRHARCSSHRSSRRSVFVRDVQTRTRRSGTGRPSGLSLTVTARRWCERASGPG